MARPINPKCFACAALSRLEAQKVHGESGDGCWNKKRCDRKRSHYNNRDDILPKRRSQQASAKIASTIETIVANSKPPPIALLYLYRQERKDAHLHALKVTVWQGESKLAQTEPVHTLGMTNSQVKHYLKEVLSVLGDKYDITEFEPPIRKDPEQCPLKPCPLKLD